MICLKSYGSDELSLRVFNDPDLYYERHTPAYLQALIDEEFLYTPEQKWVLDEDLLADKEEEECST